MDRLISLQAALDAVIRFSTNEGQDAVCTELYSEICSLPSAEPEKRTQPKKRTEERTETHACDLIGRQAAIDAMTNYFARWAEYTAWSKTVKAMVETAQEAAREMLTELPSAEPDISSYLTDRPCAVCKCHTDDGCSEWECVFERRTDG